MENAVETQQEGKVRKPLTKAFKIRTIVIASLILLLMVLPVNFDGDVTTLGYYALFTYLPLLLTGLLQVAIVYYITQIVMYAVIGLTVAVLVLAIVSLCTDKANKAFKIVSIIASVFEMIAFVFVLITAAFSIMSAFSSTKVGAALMEVLAFSYIFVLGAILTMWMFVLNIKTAKRA